MSSHNEECAAKRCADPSHGQPYEPLPEGCKCDPATWCEFVEVVCAEYRGVPMGHPCKECYHDKGCHS